MENGNKLNLFSLKISNNAFSYANLVEELGDILTTYALFRSTYDDLREKEKYNTLVTKAKDHLRSESYVNGADGVHLLKIEFQENNYLYFGKLKKKISH